MKLHSLPSGRDDRDATGESTAVITECIAEAWRRDEHEDMAWRELELRVRAARLMQDETQPRWWQLQHAL